MIRCYELSDQAVTLHQVKSHVVRAFAASKAFQSGVSLEQIFSACHCKSHKTFTQFYFKDVAWADSELFHFDSSITELTNFLGAIQAWMGNNKLKTEFIVIGDLETRSCLNSSFPMSLLDNIMEPSESVKNLGVILDAENSVQRHVANICRISYYHLH